MTTGTQIEEAHDVEALETQLLLEGIFHQYGYDFRHYTPTSLGRRIATFLSSEGITTISRLQERVLHDPITMSRLVTHLTIHVTSLFRDPRFFLTLREQVIPWLKTHPFVRIWNAGCSTGEETYSIAIVLKEEGIYDRCRIYATDVDQAILDKAMVGLYPLDALQEYSRNYTKAGGSTSLSHYYTADAKQVLLDPSLKTNVVFAQHNLATDSSFNEFHLILCRNVMIYFDKTLQDRVHKLLYQSLGHLGYLAVGDKESLKFTPFEACYEEIDAAQKIYRRIK